MGDSVRYMKWIVNRNLHKDFDGAECYCGHTFKCDCLDPDFELFLDSERRGTIKKDSN